MVQTKNRGNLIHLISWLFIFILPFLNFISKPEELLTANKVILLFPFSFTLFLCLIFYVNLLWIAPKFLNKQYWWVYSLLVLAGFGLFYLYNAGIFKYIILPEIPLEERLKEEDRQWRSVLSVIFTFLIYALTILISNVLYLLDERTKEKEISRKIEFQKVEAELSMLKLQISPHFLFNTLNNIRWQVRKKSSESEESIMKLSEVLRYIIYDVNTDKVTVRQEADHLGNYIGLQSLRIQADAQVDFTVDHDTEPFMIAPLLFIHFAENAFKYGVDGKNVPEISMAIQKTSQGILFTCRNKILNSGNSLENEGVGISNVKRRLALLYPDQHELKINEEQDYFNVELRLQVNAD